MIGDRVTVRYSCVCFVGQREITVPARGIEDVVAWMEMTMGPLLAMDHRHASPQCVQRNMKDVAIPCGTDGRVGSVTIGGVT